MQTILNNKKSTYSSPYCYYTVKINTITNRTTTEVELPVQVVSHLASSSSVLGSGGNRYLKAQLYINGAWSEEITLKSTSESWSGTTEHTKSFTLTINGLSANDTELSNIKFKVKSGASDQASGLNSTACSNITIPTGSEPPIVSSITMTEQNSSISSLVDINTKIVTNLSKKLINVSYTLDPNVSLSKIIVENGPNVIKESTTNNFEIDFANVDLYIVSSNNKVPINVRVVDSNGNYGSLGLAYYGYIPYTPPTIIESNVIVKRAGLLTGNAVLSLNGIYYKSDDVLNQSSNIVVEYKYWENKENPEIPSSYTTISNVTINNDGTFEVSNYNIGSSFEADKSYRVLVKVSDAYKSYEMSEPKSIPVGEALWTEYKDRVNFKKITIQGHNILYKNILLAQPEQDLTLSTSNWTKINATQISNIGDKLYISNGGIKVGSGVTKVLVNANILFTTGGTSSTRRGVAIYKNDTLVVYNNIKGDTTYTGASISPYLIDVQENDIIYMYGINQGGTGSIVSADYSYINVEAVE